MGTRRNAARDACLWLWCAACAAPASHGGPIVTGEPAAVPADPPRRARELGLSFGSLAPGPLNAITDVEGVRVGHVTRHEGDSVRTGVTAILPHGGNPYREKLPCGLAVANGFGKLVGATQVAELGELESPILLTSTLNVHRVADGVLDWILALPGNEGVRSVNVLVGETNDGRLNDIRARPVTPADAVAAIRGARTGPVAQGCVGAGTGTICFGWKGGIGTASRRVTAAGREFALGVLVQTNFGGERLVLGGRLVPPPDAAGEAPRDGSCMMIVATDAPLDARQLGRLARRGVLAMARVGSVSAHGSGDYTIAFSTARGAAPLADSALDPCFVAAVDALEEAIADSLLLADTTRGLGGRVVGALRLGPDGWHAAPLAASRSAGR